VVSTGSGLALAGVVSWGEECGGATPGVYADVPGLTKWINDQRTAETPATGTSEAPAPSNDDNDPANPDLDIPDLGNDAVGDEFDELDMGDVDYDEFDDADYGEFDDGEFGDFEEDGEWYVVVSGPDGEVVYDFDEFIASVLFEDTAWAATDDGDAAWAADYGDADWETSDYGDEAFASVD